MTQGMFSEESRSNPLKKKWREALKVKRCMWGNLRKDRHWCGRRGRARSLANLSFISAQLLRFFSSGKRHNKKSCPTEQWSCLWNDGRDAWGRCGVKVDQVLPYRSQERIYWALLLLLGSDSVSAGGTKMDCVRAAQRQALQALTCPHGLLQPPSTAPLRTAQQCSLSPNEVTVLGFKEKESFSF